MDDTYRSIDDSILSHREAIFILKDYFPGARRRLRDYSTRLQPSRRYPKFLATWELSSLGSYGVSKSHASPVSNRYLVRSSSLRHFNSSLIRVANAALDPPGEYLANVRNFATRPFIDTLTLSYGRATGFQPSLASIYIKRRDTLHMLDRKDLATMARYYERINF